MILRWYIDFGSGFVEVPPPRNWKELEIELLFVNDRADMPYEEFPSATVQAINFEWVGTNSKRLNDYITGGLTGATPGITEAVPIRIDFCSETGGILTSLNKYGIDLQSESCTFECDKVVAPLVKLGEIDFINSVADTVSFAYLASNQYTGPAGGAIAFSDYVKVPYTVNTIPNWTQVAVLSISTFLLFKELKEAIKTIAEDIRKLAAFTASATLSWGNVFIIAAQVITLIFDIVYFIAILIALIKLITDIITNIWQFPKYKLGMKVEDLMRKASASVGLKFKSTLLENSNLTIVPRKIIMPNPANPLNIFFRGANEILNNGRHYGYYDGTFKQLILDLQDVFNASGKVVNGTFHFETVNFWNSQSAYKLPNTTAPGFHANIPEPHGTNAARLSMNYFIQYSLDEQDLNTYNDYTGTTVQVSLKQKKVKSQTNILSKGLTRVQLNFAHAKRKEHMSQVELVLTSFLGEFGLFADLIIQGINNLIALSQGNPPSKPVLTGIGNTRVGWMELSSDFIGVPKLFYGTGTNDRWRVAQNSRTKLAAINLLQQYHGINLATRGNQYLLYSNKKIPLCCKDFVTLTTSNILVTSDNKKGKFSKIVWSPHNETGVCDYGIQEKYTNNLIETIVQDGR